MEFFNNHNNHNHNNNIVNDNLHNIHTKQQFNNVNNEIEYLMNNGVELFYYYNNNCNNKQEIFNKYLDNNPDINSISNTPSHTVYNEPTCIYCMSSNIINQDNITVCDDCYAVNEINTITTEPAFYEKKIDKIDLSYKKINHLIEFLNQKQGLENYNIPSHIINSIKSQLINQNIIDKNLNIIDADFIKPSVIKKILSKMKLNKFFNHIPLIHYRITGIYYFNLDIDTLEKITSIFKKCLYPFSLFCPKNRYSFLSYNFTVYKILQIINKKEYLKFFSLLKNKEKLQQHNKLWKNICNYLNLPYIENI